jgi:thiol-disulfide isomerase/thioredoxin
MVSPGPSFPMKSLLLLCTAALVVFTGCNRSGVIDATGGNAAGRSGGGSATKSAKPIRIGYGQPINIQDYAVQGKTTIFDFTSEFCPPCRAIAPALHKLHADRADIVVVEVDLNRPGVKGRIDWQSPLAAQYGMDSIPAFKVYGPNGQLKTEGNAARELVTGMLQ